MDVLLDTHIALWMFEDSPRLTSPARMIVLDPKNRLIVSVVSMWEIALKHAKRPEGNINCKEFISLCEKSRLDTLDLTPFHLKGLDEMPLVHTDPFDRLLINQARLEKASLITHDGLIAKYGYDFIIHV